MLLRCNLTGIVALEIFLLSVGLGSAFAQAGPVASAQQDQVRTIKLPLEQWLVQGERTEIPWKVSLSRPLLTYQLRSLVRITAEVPVDVLQRQGIPHDLHFIVKAAPERGAWDSEESYTRFRVEARLDPRSELQMLAELYLQPGAYNIATIVYDATSGRRNLSLNRVQVSDPDHDPFPQLLDLVPKVQFLPPPDEAAPLGRAHILLPVKTQRPVRFTLILDLSTHQEEVDGHHSLHPGYYPYPSYPYPPNPEVSPEARERGNPSSRSNQEIYEQSRLLQTATLLSAIGLEQGCIQVTAFDIFRQRTILPLTSADDVGWGKVRDEILSPDRAMVSVAEMKGRRDAAKFLERQLEQTMSQPPSCKQASRPALQIIAILSRGIGFPSGSDKPRIQPQCDCKVVYLQQSDPESSSDLKNLLRPLSPLVLEFGSPQDFRQKLLEFTRAMEKAAD